MCNSSIKGRNINIRENIRGGVPKLKGSDLRRLYFAEHQDIKSCSQYKSMKKYMKYILIYKTYFKNRFIEKQEKNLR